MKHYLSIFFFLFSLSSMNAQNYSGLWQSRDDTNVLYAEVYIDLERRADGSYTGTLYYYDNVYVFVSSKPSSVYGKAYKSCTLTLTKKNNQAIPYNLGAGCELLLYNDMQKSNRVDFVNKSNSYAPSSIYNMYNGTIASQNALAQINGKTSSSQNQREVAIKRAKEAFIATANGDVAKLEKLLTPDFYSQYYPYSDAKVKEILLSVPYERRKLMIDQISYNTDVSTIVNRAGDVITVMFTNRTNHSIFTVQLLDEYGTGDWRIFDYDYGR